MFVDDSVKRVRPNAHSSDSTHGVVDQHQPLPNGVKQHRVRNLLGTKRRHLLAQLEVGLAELLGKRSPHSCLRVEDQANTTTVTSRTHRDTKCIIESTCKQTFRRAAE